MIQPKMVPPGSRHATMLAFITSDVAIRPALLRHALNDAVNKSFNRITIDGDTSTNDSVIALGNGFAGNSPINKRDSRFRIFQEALDSLCLELARMMVHDGEGVSRFVTLRVRGARTARDAESAARTIANSPLVKTSWCGGDPNWGRILCALGNSSAEIDQTRVDVGYRGASGGKIVYGFRAGRPTKIAWRDLTRITSSPEFEVSLNLHLGNAEYTFYASDLTEAYVTFNKGDTGDPASLGG
jgi:glutamate N-acetyltransferase/amino-acid N-acetyltransferase